MVRAGRSSAAHSGRSLTSNLDEADALAPAAVDVPLQTIN